MHPTTRTEINRANSQHSTGPTTPEGKKASSMNALRHGLTSKIAVMPTEDIELYEAHLKSFTDEYNPQGATEAQLVQSLADASWRLNRIAAMETNILKFQSMVVMPENDTKAIANLSLHSQRLSRQFEKTMRELRELQKTRLAQQQKDLNEVLDIMELYKSKGETYHLTNDGFVFSHLEIQSAQRARTRQRRAQEAHNYLSKGAAA